MSWLIRTYLLLIYSAVFPQANEVPEENSFFSNAHKLIINAPELLKNISAIFVRPGEHFQIGKPFELTINQQESIAPNNQTITYRPSLIYSSHPQQPIYNNAMSNPCTLPQQTGNGPYRIPRWNFNPSQSKCELFYWSGCCGNANNFQTRQACEQTCEETTNPCAYGSHQLILCTPSTASQPPCSGQQFCHIGENPLTTVCCNKPALVDLCQQPLNVGVGNANLQRWYFNPSAQLCQKIVYNGLQGNENNFLSRIDCEAICQVNPCAVGVPYNGGGQSMLYCSATTQSVCPTNYYCHIGGDARTSVCCQGFAGDPCAQPMNQGQGSYQLQRWYWDVTNLCCRSFMYTGQKGNQNNFLTREECERFCYVDVNPCRLPIEMPLQPCVPGPNTCDNRPDRWCHIGATPQTTVCCPAEPLNPCLQPLNRGVGSAALGRFFYNTEMQQCQPFTYCGLKGNQNNFLTREECEFICLPNPCPSGRPYLGVDGRPQSCTVSATLSTCPNSYWCHIGADSATTVCCPDASLNPCQLPMSTGEGYANLERFYFDSISKTCKPFVYKGLKGNQNNFLNLKSCQLACQPFDNPCIGQPAKSSATGQVLFCSATNRDTCPVNFWCHLGATPESTVCCPGATNPCSVPLAPGTGNSGLARWYYNADERQCIQFQYNGRRGNQNNFITKEECELNCPAQLCLLSIDRGACSGRQTRYAYNRQTGQCVPFDYTGCGGNLNNFLTMSECMQVCGNIKFR